LHLGRPFGRQAKFESGRLRRASVVWLFACNHTVAASLAPYASPALASGRAAGRYLRRRPIYGCHQAKQSTRRDELTLAKGRAILLFDISGICGLALRMSDSSDVEGGERWSNAETHRSLRNARQLWESPCRRHRHHKLQYPFRKWAFSPLLLP
jgi:hypothetical protein